MTGLDVCLVGRDAHPPWNHAQSILTRRMAECLSSSANCTLITTRAKEDSKSLNANWSTRAIGSSGTSGFDAVRLGIRARQETHDIVHIVGASVIVFAPVYKMLGARGAIIRQIFSPHDLNDGLVRPVRRLVNNLFVGAYAFTSPWNGPWERDLGHRMRKFLFRPPIDCELYRPSKANNNDFSNTRQHDFTILYMGPLWPSRFPARNVLGAIRSLITRGLDVGLNVITSTRSSLTFDKEVLSLAKRLGLDRNVVLERRNLSEPERVAALNSADVVLFPYVGPEPEQLADPPLAILEAMACGKVALCTGVLSIPEVIQNGVNGYLIQSASSSNISDGIMRALESPVIDELGARARERIIGHFSYPVVSRSLLEAYTSLLAS